MDLMLIVFITSFLILVLGAVFKKIQEISLTEPLIAMVTGIILGPHVLEVIQSDVPEKLKILEKTCEFTIAIALMATAMRIKKNFFIGNIQSQAIIVIVGMLLMWFFSSVIFYLLFPHFVIAECLLLGAIVTPTDPVLSATIVSGKKAEKYLPKSVRQTLSFESGVNDGLAFPIVFFSLFLLSSSEFPLSKWLTHTLLYKNILCAAIAFGVGSLAGIGMHKANKAGLMTTKAVLPFSIGLSLMLLSALNLLGMNGIIAVFVGGLGFARAVSGKEDIQEEKVQESMERIAMIPVFFVFGLMVPWYEWVTMGWTAVFIVLLLLFFRRIPVFLILMPFLPQFKKKTNHMLIMGWFGPIGIAALYYAILAKEKAAFDDAWVIPSLIVFTSTILHGITSLPFGKLYHKNTSANEQD